MSVHNADTKHSIILHEGLINSFSDFEQNNPVDEYICYDWNCWPLLRILSSYQLSIHARREPATGLRSLLVRRFKEKSSETPHTQLASKLKTLYNNGLARRNEKELKRALEHDTCHSVSPDAPDHEIVILTLSGRRTMLGGSLFDIYSDPVTQNFRKNGLTPMVWEQGTEKWPRYSNSAWITKQLAIEAKHNEYYLQKNPPGWFLEFTYWLNKTHNHVITWGNFRRTINLVQSRSLVFKKWLDSCRARLLISVCWYDPLVMAATLAAKRTGVTTVDLQHGIQNNVHPAYNGWNHVPADSYDLIPDIFWSWGVHDAKRMMARNPVIRKHCKTIVGGNLWYNQWQENEKLYTELPGKLLEDKSRDKTILVTLQHGRANFTDRILQAITECPTDWFWLIRMHPASPPHENKSIRNSLYTLGMDNIDHEAATTASLYSLLGICDVHITGHSTSGLEALGFGVPTITVTESGASAFKEYIEYGVILTATTSNKIREAVELSSGISGDNCKYSVRKVFAPTTEASQGINELLSIANIRGN